MIDDSLDWLATQYVLDELPSSERESFEERLSHDLAACEAVARASQLRFGLEKAFADVEEPSILSRPLERNRHPQFAVAAAFLALACVLFVALFVPSIDRPTEIAQGPSPNVTEPETSLNDNVALIAMWRSGMQKSNPDPEPEPNDLESREFEDESQRLAKDVAVPSWLLAGVSLQLNESRPGLPQK